ncbi:hypothetical protein [Paraburkholderia hospita]|uniref:Uncharacterized protein n=1 Tax=Paraburkholderia hospita TaxID=169430 RepID=A0AAN1MH96_9BURK|nr:hypothetical protein [Paraburkholderia hospita]AUT67044.1 hypothetical protein C2L64_00815 [Paraburkholderia hospita]SEH41135.1 hypothetical protein SAMN05192544_1001305 [Paraburkholderia hospita]
MLTTPHYTPLVDDTDAADPLGTGALVDAFYRSVFPGINNVVEFVRIYAAICWMIRRIDDTAHSTKNPDILALSKAGLEKIQLLLTWYNGNNGVKGLAGRNRRYPPDNSRVTLSFEKIPSERVARLLEAEPTADIADPGIHYLTPVQYRPSLEGGLAFIRESREARGTYILTAAGKKLADAYEQAISGSKWCDWLADLNKVTTCREEVAEMGDVLDVRTPSQQEREVFARAYYPEVSEDVTGAKVPYRCNGITLVLRALEAEQDSPREPEQHGIEVDAIRYTMARGTTLQGVAVNLDGLEEVHGWWMNLQLKELSRLALDSLSRNVASWIHDAVTDERPRRDIVACADGLGERMERALPEAHRKRVGSYVEHLEDQRGTAKTFYEAGLKVPALRVEEMLGQLLKVCNFSQRTPQESDALVEAYKALVYCAVEARQHLSNPYVQQTVPPVDRLSLQTLRGLLERFEDERPAAFLAHIVQFYVVLLHFTVARDRTIQARDGRNRFIFTVGENGLQRVTAKGPIPNVDLGLARFRLRQALLLLAQCQFVETADEGKTFALTRAGRLRLVRGTPDFGFSAAA